MNQIKIIRTIFLSLAILLLAAGASCATAAPVEEGEATATAVPEFDDANVPEEVALVRESALNFLYASAKVCVPPAGTPWSTEVNNEFADIGTNIYLFSAEDCVLNVSYPEPANEETLYYVALRNATLDFCWQAFIDAEGDIKSTDYEAVEPGLANPSVINCEKQGYQFEIRTREDGKQCGACVFAEDDFCNAWDFFYGNCGPTEE
jgi:putative hemolysin